MYEPGRRTILTAGGIGITPILPMASAAHHNGVNYSIIYLGSRRRKMAFLNRLHEEHGDRLSVWAKDENDGKRYDLDALFANKTYEGLRVYCCGPKSLLTGLQHVLSSAPLGVPVLLMSNARRCSEEPVHTS